MGVLKRFTADASVTIPAGVKKIRLIAEKKYVQTAAQCKDYSCGANTSAQATQLWIDQNGRGWGSGLNTFGQLGCGDQTPRSSPTAMLGVPAFVMVCGDNNGATGAYYGLDFNGVVWAWGLNSNGQLGLGDVTHRSSPVAIPAQNSFIQIATTGGSSTWGITTAGKVYGWGFAPAVSGDTIPHSSPVAAVGVAGLVFKQIFNSFGTGNVYFLTRDNKLYGTGVNVLGSLGVGDLVGRSSPVAVGPSINFATVSNGGLSSVALDTSGAAWAWGSNSKGQLGTGNTTNSSTPIAVTGGLTFTQVVFSSNNCVYGLTAAGAVYAWGDNNQGALCQGDNTARSSPCAVLGLSGVVIKKIYAAASGNFTESCVWFLAQDGTLYAGGGNEDGQLGVGDAVSRSSAVAVLGGFKFIDIVPGGSVMGLCDDGIMRAWGRNLSGQLGLGDVTPRSSPVAVEGGAKMPPYIYRDEKVIAVTPGTTYSLKMNFGMVTFGTEVISVKPFVDSVTMLYEQ